MNQIVLQAGSEVETKPFVWTPLLDFLAQTHERHALCVICPLYFVRAWLNYFHEFYASLLLS